MHILVSFPKIAYACLSIQHPLGALTNGTRPKMLAAINQNVLELAIIPAMPHKYARGPPQVAGALNCRPVGIVTSSAIVWSFHQTRWQRDPFRSTGTKKNDRLHEQEESAEDGPLPRLMKRYCAQFVRKWQDCRLRIQHQVDYNTQHRDQTMQGIASTRIEPSSTMLPGVSSCE